jgi:3-hydroxyisobutyrate dehydrogenase
MLQVTTAKIKKRSGFGISGYRFEPGITEAANRCRLSSDTRLGVILGLGNQLRRRIIKVGFIGLGNVGAKLAGTLLRNKVDLVVHDLDADKVRPFVDAGAGAADSPLELVGQVDTLITCLPSPEISARVMEDEENGALHGFSAGKIWLEMSTTDTAEVRRLGSRVIELGGRAADCPVSGGCHRAETGNIAILAGCDRATFESVLPLLTVLGREVLHTGELGSASTLKVCTNYLATANLVSVCEALTVSKAAGIDLVTAYHGIRISSGNSFVHETEGQVILNGSRNINFTMDLVLKDVGLFQQIAERGGVELELSPLLLNIFRDGQARFGPREWSPNIIRRLEEATGLSITAAGFPDEIVDNEDEAGGAEVKIGAR